MTLKQLFEEFGHDPKWHNMALQSAKSMVGVYLRKLGNNDIDKLTDFDYELQWMMSEQPEGDKVRAKACLHYLLEWARENGKCVAQIEHPIKKVEKKKTLAQRMKEKKSEPIPLPPPPEPKPTADEMMNSLCEKSIVNMYDSFHVGKPSTGTIYHDTASRQAAALLLTRITAGKPVLNFTATCKRMLRVHKERGNFFYYENAPEPVKMMVDKIDLSGLAEVWKVTKDRRI